MSEREKLLVRYGILSGQIQATYDLAINKDGGLFVGVMGRPYSDVVAPWLEHQNAIRGVLNMTDCQIMSCQGCPDCGSSIVQIPEGE